MTDAHGPSPFTPLAFDDTVGSLEARALHERYRAGDLTPADVVAAVYDRIGARGDDSVWITLVDRQAAVAAALGLVGGPDDPATPLFGLPYAIKDNFDVAGLPTTAACPGFAYVPAASAEVCERLAAAGAILIGKTNLDQFATGLNGTRSPYGAPTTPFDHTRISGGSSSGSGVAVSAGLVTFSLGTDTAGSGRVPAALTNTVGIKPSFGLVSTSGLLPACRSLDCASVFSLTVADGALVLSVLAGRDEGDAWSRDLPVPSPRPVPRPLHTLVLAVPRPADIDFAGNRATESAWSSFLDALLAAGVQLVETSFTPFYDAGRKLYAGGWLAERLSGIEAFLDENPDAVHPVTSRVLSAGRSTPGTQVFRDLDEARRIAAGIAPLWRSVDALLTPTVTTTFTVEEMLADPIALNSRLGQFTTFTNILDLAAIAVPCSIASNGLPFGITVSAPAGSDGSLAGIAAAIERLVDGPLGATGYTRVSADRPSLPAETGGGGGVDDVLLAVVGAHLSGMPLNGELTDLGATFAMRTATAAAYRLHALPGTVPPKPALRRVSTGGVRIEVEVYRLDARAFGRFVSLVTSPLAIGTVELADGSTVHGFVCEPHAFDGAPDVSEFGGWRAYRRQ